MKKKLPLLLTLILILTLCVCGLFACGGVKFRVNFIVDGEVYAAIDTSGSEIIEMPEDPVKEGFEFDGWYWDKDTWKKPFTANSLLDAPLSINMKVYAKWILEDGGDNDQVEEIDWALVYVVEDNEITAITTYGKTLTNLVIPSTINDTAITSIGDSAFAYCYSLKSIEIPNSVTSIGDYAFRDCYSLTSITFEENIRLTNIGAYAFYVCTALTSITLPYGVISIGEYAFSICSDLVRIIIPSSVTSIGEYAFNYCGKLTIYCETETEPSGWASDWNYDNRPVVWGYNG